jgi:hypothetical protein
MFRKALRDWSLFRKILRDWKCANMSMKSNPGP